MGDGKNGGVGGGLGVGSINFANYFVSLRFKCVLIQ
jgi:hypothetical protein